MGARTTPIDIEFWTEMGGEMGEIFQTWIREFNESQPDIRIVDVFSGEYDQLQNKLMATLETGAWPVLTSVDYKHVAFFAREGVFQALDSLAQPGELDDLTPGLLDDLRYQGQLYAMPFNRSVQGIFLNSDLFRRAGLDPAEPPQTWEDFIAYGQSLTDPERDCFGTYALHAAQWWFEPYVLQAGGQISDEDGNFIFNNEYGCLAAQLLQDEVHKHGFARVPDVALPHHGPLSRSASQFVQSKIGMFRTSTNMHTVLSRDLVEFDWTFVELPAGPAGKAVTSGGANFSIMANATQDQKQAAWTFLQWVTSREKTAEWHMNTGYIPVRIGVEDLPQVKSFHQEHPTWRVAMDQIENVHPTSIGVLNAPQWQSVIDSAMDRIVIENEDVKTVLDQAVGQLQPSINRARQDNTLITR